MTAGGMTGGQGDDSQAVVAFFLLAKLKADGWFLAVTRGSHRQFKHPIKSGRVTVPGNHEAIEFHIQGLVEDGLPVPQPQSFVEYFETAALRIAPRRDGPAAVSEPGYELNPA